MVVRRVITPAQFSTHVSYPCINMDETVTHSFRRITSKMRRVDGVYIA
jgi:hypothetical protein